MIITFKQAKDLLAPYAGKAGKCSDDESVGLYVKEVIQQLLFRGASGNLRKWAFVTQNGTFTAPPDLELPVKMKVDTHVGMVYDKFYEFYDQNTLSDCSPCEDGLVEEPNTYFTSFDIPCGGARLLAVPLCKEDADAKLLISGIDETGKEIYMPHKGERFKGEYLGIDKEKNKYTQKTFVKITGIEKSVTKNYVRLYWYDPSTGDKGVLAEYRPGDTHPSFRRYRVVGLSCDACFKITVLGRIRFCDNYHDNDIIPVSNMRALKLMGQQLQAEDNDDIEAAAYKNQRVEQTLNNENNYKRTPSAPIDFFGPTSPGNIKNLI
jgi:hypothetical protein